MILGCDIYSLNIQSVGEAYQNIVGSCCGCSTSRLADRWLTSAPYWTVCTRRCKNRKLLFRQSNRLLEPHRTEEPWARRTRQLGEDRKALVKIIRGEREEL